MLTRAVPRQALKDFQWHSLHTFGDNFPDWAPTYLRGCWHRLKMLFRDLLEPALDRKTVSRSFGLERGELFIREVKGYGHGGLSSG